MGRRFFVLLVFGLVLVVAAVASGVMLQSPGGEVAGSSSTLYVATDGQDAAGFGSQSKPYKTISYALGKVSPGMKVIVTAGTYPEYLITAKSGKPGRPISLEGQGSVILTGDTNHGRIMEVRHDYYSITGFEFNGQPNTIDILLWLQEADNTNLTNNYFHHAQGECVRVKYQSTKNTVQRSRFEYCGLYDFGGGGTGKNGEGLYLGTAPEQLDRNPTVEVDQTNNNLIRNNTFVTHGNECVDIKEGSEKNIVEFNDCTGQLDPNSGGFDARGSSNTFRYNKSYGNVGAGIRFGGDAVGDGINNEAYGNKLNDNQNVALKVMRLPQGLICGNTESGNTGGFSNEKTITNPPCAWPLSSPGVQP